MTIRDLIVNHILGNLDLDDMIIKINIQREAAEMVNLLDMNDMIKNVLKIINFGKTILLKNIVLYNAYLELTI
jgi:hypothetical protein